MDLKSLAQRAKQIQPIVLVAGACLGGAWAVYQFGTTRAPTKAQAEIEKLVSENVELQRRLKGDANLSVKLTAEQFCGSSSDVHLIDARVELVNHGTRSALLDLSNPKTAGFFAVPLDIRPDGNVRFMDVHQPKLYTFDPATPGKPSTLGVLDVQPAVITALRYMIPVGQPGLYLVSFSAPMSKTDVEVAKERLARETAKPDTLDARWHARGYVLIQEKACK